MAEEMEDEYDIADVDASINALVELLIKKKLITSEEFQEVLDSYYEEE